MAYQLELDTYLYTEGPEGIEGPGGSYWSTISVSKDGVSVVQIENTKWPVLRIHPQSNVLIRMSPKLDYGEYRFPYIHKELKDESELGVVIFLDEKTVEFYRKGIGFFRVLKNGGMLFYGYRNNSNEIFFEKITKRYNEVPLSEVRKEVIDGE